MQSDHGISRALLQADADFRPVPKKAGFLTRDPRMKERKKYGLKAGVVLHSSPSVNLVLGQYMEDKTFQGIPWEVFLLVDGSKGGQKSSRKPDYQEIPGVH